MKKLYIIFAFLLLASLSKAAIVGIGVLTVSFFPAAATAQCGDTIVWGLANSSETHTTTSTSVPAGAAGWGANLSSTAMTYSMVVTVAGTYSYQCNFHVGMGMKGSITVTCPNGVSSINNSFISSAYPSPFTNKFTVETPNADCIALYNALGEKIKTVSVQKGQTKTDIIGSDIHEGIYFYCVIKEGMIIETRKVIKN